MGCNGSFNGYTGDFIGSYGTTSSSVLSGTLVAGCCFGGCISELVSGRVYRGCFFYPSTIKAFAPSFLFGLLCAKYGGCLIITMGVAYGLVLRLHRLC